MIRVTTQDAAKLHECRSDLERVLAALDRIGAGIAAIHVNAAIEQIGTNIDLVECAEVDDALPLYADFGNSPKLRH